MMKIAFKRYSFAAFSLLSIASLAMPASVWAETPQETRRAEMKADREEKIAEMKENHQEAFCSVFTKNAERIAGNLSDRLTKLEARQGNRQSALEARRDDREARLEGSRSAADERRNAMYVKLDTRAESDAQKAAVAEFRKTVEAAVDTRRDAVDAAIALFRKNVDVAISGRKDDMGSAAAKFKSAVEAALNTAKSDCENGTNPETVRSHFKKNLAAARTALQNDRKEADKVGEQVRVSAAARRTDVKNALDVFKAAVEGARVELKKAFGETTDTESATTP